MARNNKSLWKKLGRAFRSARQLGRKTTWEGLKPDQKADFLSFAMQQQTGNDNYHLPAKDRRKNQRNQGRWVQATA